LTGDAERVEPVTKPLGCTGSEFQRERKHEQR
jgi:hypothetical protein